MRWSPTAADSEVFLESFQRACLGPQVEAGSGLGPGGLCT